MRIHHLFWFDLSESTQQVIPHFSTWSASLPQPIGSMYGIFAYIWLIFMGNVGKPKYTIHGSYGQCFAMNPAFGDFYIHHGSLPLHMPHRWRQEQTKSRQSHPHIPCGKACEEILLRKVCWKKRFKKQQLADSSPNIKVILKRFDTTWITAGGQLTLHMTCRL